ncbi:PAS domain S-box protein [Ktedonospora formicarum]|uniref:histidine kinase n=1 Tax=Ktedonospora formicarum TaxID=2778364 RepID=A0A8J3MSE5_9CHLR|nr:PAS domain S-box protein [Ktedonospora formicarum]GHO46992.1 hypothetical protein KSX_51550 [Ktedonospora formicarum]
MKHSPEDVPPQEYEERLLQSVVAEQPVLRFAWERLRLGKHEIQFYETDAFLLDTVVSFVRTGLTSGAACLVLATSYHLQALSQRLQTDGIDLSMVHAQGSYIALDAAEVLTHISIEGSPDPTRFTSFIDGLISQLGKRHSHVRIFGEMVTLLWQQGKPKAALELEALWNNLHSIGTHSFSLLCAYPLALFTGQEQRESFLQMRELKTHVLPDEHDLHHATTTEQRQAVSLLPKQNRTLQTESVKHQAIEAHLAFKEQRYRRLFEASTDGILLVDPRSGRIIDANPTLFHLLGMAYEQVVGSALWQIGLLDNQATQEKFLLRVQEERLVHMGTMACPFQDAKPCFIEWVSTLFEVQGEEMMQCNLRDMTAYKSAEADSLYLAAIVTSSDDAILSKNLDGIITSWNAAAERMYGYSAQEIIGKPVTILFLPGHQDEFQSIMEHIRRGEHVEHFETTRVRKDGSFVPVSVTISPITDRGGTIIGASSIARDISERKALEQERDAFVGVVTHELKTPLTSLQGNVQMAQRRLIRLLNQNESLSETQLQILEDVLLMLGRGQQSLRMQNRLINDLLDVSRLQEGKLELALAPCDLIEVVSATVHDQQAAQPTRLITLVLPELDHLMVTADRDRLQQVLGNYLTNALKFSPETESVRVGLDLDGDMVRVWVQDHGPGLTQEQQHRIWNRFYQVTNVQVQRGWRTGLGLGLYICHQLISQHHGQVGIESVPGQGATFWFTLPFSDASRKETKAHQ